MSDPYVGEIRMFAGNFAPRGWAFCDGQLLQIAQHAALFSLLGTLYGGDGESTFGLPDMRGRIPLHFGNGPGLSPRTIASVTGSEQVTVTAGQLPVHGHGGTLHSGDNADTTIPVGAVPARPAHDLYLDSPPDTPLNAAAITASGGGQPHTNLMPTLCVNFMISLFGVFPSQT